MAITLVRSPRYPIIGLREAIEKVTLVYKADGRNKIPKELVAEHIGYKGLNGKSLGIISAILKYGLIEGKRDAMWVSSRAVDIIEREADDPERILAIQAAASDPESFKEISEAFPHKASDSAIRSFLITKRTYLAESAERLIRSYRETQELVENLAGVYDSPKTGPENDMSAVAEIERPVAAKPQASLVGVTMVEGEREWLRGPLSRESTYRLVVSGEMGPREIGKLIKLLEAQKAVLDDDEDLIG